MTKKQKKVLYRIIIAFILMIVLSFIPVRGYWMGLLFLVPYAVIGYDILRKAFLGIIHGEIFDENFLMAVATIGAMLLGDYKEGVAVMLFYQIGELFQSVAVGKSRRNISALMDIRPDYAYIEDERGNIQQMDPEDIEVGTVIVVRPGERIPLDGEVMEGSSSLNTSALTGESIPKEVSVGDMVISGCVNLNGVLKISTTKGFEESTVSKILDLVENSSMKKSRTENFITKFAKYYTPIVCYSALALAFIPPIILLVMGQEAGWTNWITRALTFLVISCPCALVISIPLSFFGGIGGASASGILVKGSNYLEALSRTKYVVFDKTGTLTKGVFEVTGIYPSEAFKNTLEADEEKAEYELLKYAVYAESYSNHPISKSLREAYVNMTQKWEDEQMHANVDENSKNISLNSDIVSSNSSVGNVEEISGEGVMAEVNGAKVAAGNAKLMKRLGLTPTESKDIGTIVHIAVGDVYAGYILIADIVKETAKDAIASLKRFGVKKTIMLTGDSREVAQLVASKLGVDEVRSELLPADKVAEVEKLLEVKGAKEKLAFVGDGINDAPVLSRADIGIAMGALGSDAAIEAADIVLMDDNPEKIALAMSISGKCLRIVYQNIVFALSVKGICLLLGALGITNMWVAIFADVGVMVLAVLNAIRCLRVSGK